MKNREQPNRSKRGTVMLLVVVCLGLMAVLGVVYLVVARTDRTNTRAINATMDMDMSFDGAMNYIRQQIYESSVDSRGVLMGQDASGASGRTSRWFDIPEAGTTINVGANEGSTPDQRWLTLPSDSGSARFTRFYSYNGGSYSTNRYNPGTNAFDIATPGLPEVAVMDPTGAADSVWYMLPSTSSQAARYRLATRILDTSGLANINVGAVDSSLVNNDGTYLSGYALWRLIKNSDTAANLHNNAQFPKGRGGGTFAANYGFVLEDWHNLMMTIEFPTSRDSTRVRTVRQVEFFDYTDELEMRARDPRRVPYTSRPEGLLPNTLGDSSDTRDLFTSYSFDRNIRPAVLFHTPVLSNTTYMPGDIVQQNSNLYECLEPTWVPTGTILAAWATGQTYEVGTLVHVSGITYRCRVRHTSSASVNTANTSNWEPVFQLANTTGYTTSSSYVVTSPRTRRPVMPRFPMRVNVNAVLPSAPTWQGDRSYLVGDVATGLKADSTAGDPYLVTMSHYGYANPLIYDIYSGAAPAVPSSYAPTAPGRDAAASAYWDFTPPFAAGIAWMPGQRAVADNGNVYICRYPIPASSGGRSPRDDQPYRTKGGAEPGNGWDYGGWYWRQIQVPPKVFLTQAEVLAQSAASLAALMRSNLVGPPRVPNTYPTSYTEEEARAFAVNYITYRHSGGRVNGGKMFLPNGPSLLDPSGLCVRGGWWTSGGLLNSTIADMGAATPQAAEFRSETANKAYIAYAAQPFINEVAVHVDPARQTTFPTHNRVDLAIELVNPHDATLDLSGWRLSLRDADGNLVSWNDNAGLATTLDIDLGVVFPNGIPGHNPTNNSSYAVITYRPPPAPPAVPDSSWPPAVLNGRFASGCTSASVVVDPADANNRLYQQKLMLPYGTTGHLVLTRPIIVRGSTVPNGVAVVDRFPLGSLVPGAAPAETDPPSVSTIQRPNANRWACAYYLFSAVNSGPAANAGPDELGKVNALQPSNQASLPNPLPYLPLHDRFAEATALNVDGDSRLRNLADFNRIARVCTTNDSRQSEVYKTGNANNKLVGERLVDIISAAVTGSFAQSQYPYEAQIRFDFRATPTYYWNPSDVQYVGDPRAVALLDHITLVDRAQDVLDVGGGTNDVNKVRVPGRINVNTAPAAVLRAVHDNLMTDKMVANIISYRTREVVPQTYNGVTAFGFASAPAALQGYGIRTGGELYYVLRPQRYIALTATSTSGDIMAEMNASWDGGNGSGVVDSYDGGVVRLVIVAGNAPTPGMTVVLNAGASAGSFIVGQDLSSLAERDVPFARVANLMTTRSDAFIVYGLLEAVRPNPKASHNNGVDWYGAVTDDPDNATAPNFLVARRRFMAVIDRSYCNVPRGAANFTLPRVVGTRDLPP